MILSNPLNMFDMNSYVFNKLKDQLLNPITDGQEVTIVFYTTVNSILWKYLENESNNEIYFVKFTKEVEVLYNKIFVYDSDKLLPPFSLKISPIVGGSDFNYKIYDWLEGMENSISNGNLVKELVELFVNKLPNLNQL